MKFGIKKIIMIALALSFIAGLSVVGSRAFDYMTGENAYEDAEKLSGITEGGEEGSWPEDAENSAADEIYRHYVSLILENEHAAKLRDTDISALKEENEDVLGWILIPDTVISYPIVQGTNNSYYLKHTWDDRRSSVGAIFMECENNSDFSDFNTIIYGHRMRDDSMFGSLGDYEEQEFWEDHPYVFIADETSVYLCEVFSAYYASDDTETYWMRLNKVEDREEYLVKRLEYSVIDTRVVPEANDKIITLSTCTGDGGYRSRWVVQCVIRGQVLKSDLIEKPENDIENIPEEDKYAG